MEECMGSTGENTDDCLRELNMSIIDNELKRVTEERGEIIGFAADLEDKINDWRNQQL